MCYSNFTLKFGTFGVDWGFAWLMPCISDICHVDGTLCDANKERKALSLAYLRFTGALQGLCPAQGVSRVQLLRALSYIYRTQYQCVCYLNYVAYISVSTIGAANGWFTP
jgi:hypothetical protein